MCKCEPYLLRFRGEYLCPLCRQLANSVLPLSPQLGERAQVVRSKTTCMAQVLDELSDFLRENVPKPVSGYSYYRTLQKILILNWFFFDKCVPFRLENFSCVFYQIENTMASERLMRLQYRYFVAWWRRHYEFGIRKTSNYWKIEDLFALLIIFIDKWNCESIFKISTLLIVGQQYSAEERNRIENYQLWLTAEDWSIFHKINSNLGFPNL